MQKKAIRIVTHSNYIAHSELLLKDLNLLNVKDLMDIKLIKFLHKLYHINLPIYFNDYTPHLEKRETRYNLRSPTFTERPTLRHYCQFTERTTMCHYCQFTEEKYLNLLNIPHFNA